MASSTNKRTGRRLGFTILDVMLALVIGLIVVVTAREMLVQLALSDERLDKATRLENRERNASRQLVDLVSRIEVRTDTASNFTGQPWRAVFPTWCSVPRGWQERCSATLAIDTLVHPSRLYITTSRGDSLVLQRRADGTTLRYFADPDDPETWSFHWGRGITTPVGMAIVTPFDTTLLRIGTRD
jgi:hypothetical protein